MADLNARMDSFVSMVLDVSGRVRANDLQGVTPQEAAGLLHEYAMAHPEKSLDFDGETLRPKGSAPAGYASPSSAGAAATQPPAMPVAAPAATVQIEAASYGAATAAPEPLPAWAQQGPGMPSADSLPDSEIGYGAQAPAPGGYYGTADAAPPDYAAAQGAGTFAAANDFAVPPVSNASATLDYLSSASPVIEMPTRVNGLWWLAVVMFGFPGALVAWFVNREKTGAKAFLIVAIVLLVLSVLSVIASIALMGAAFSAVPSP